LLYEVSARTFDYIGWQAVFTAKVPQRYLFEVVSVIKRRHDEGAIRRCSDHAMLDQDIKRVDDIYLWFVRLKEEGIRLTKK
jgi:hypothetical protein